MANITPFVSHLSSSRRRVLAALAAMPFFSSEGVRAQATRPAWAPTRPMRIIVPFAPGGTADIIGRHLAQFLTSRLGQSVVVENRPGGSNTVATEALVKADPDGHTLGMISTSHATNTVLMKSLPYDSIRSILPLSLVGRTPILLVVNANSEARSIEQLVEGERKRPGSISWGSPGVGSAAHLAGEVFRMKTRTSLVHVPYRGGGPAMNDLLGGQIQCMFNALTSTLPLVEDGKFRGLGVASSARVAKIPDVPTFTERGIDLEMYEWFGMVLPAETPADIASRLHAELMAFLRTGTAQERLVGQGVEIVPQSQAEFRRYIEAEITKARSVVEAAGIQPS